MARAELWVFVATLSALAATLPGGALGTDEPRISVVDLAVRLADVPLSEGRPPGAYVGQASPTRLREGGVVGVGIPLSEPRRGAARDVPLDAEFSALNRWIAASRDLRQPGCGPSGDRIRTWLTLTGAAELATEPSKIGLWMVRGVRIFGLVGVEDNELGTSWLSPPPLVGLSSRGRDVVRRLYENGGVIDIAGGSDATRDDVLELAARYHGIVVALSANARALADDRRNLTDSELRSIAASGGLIAAGFDQHLIVRGRTAHVRDLVAQIRHMTRVAGVDHVAIASGFEGGIRPPDGLENASKFPALARALLGSGFSREDVERIFLRNALRILCPAPRARP